MRVEIVSLFPELFETFLRTSIVGRAVSTGAMDVQVENPRAFGLGKHRSVDDTPYGGGSGMVMRVDCVVRCLEALDATFAARGTTPAPVTSEAEGAIEAVETTEAAPALPVEASPEALGPAADPPPRAHRILLDPQGARFDQAKAIELAGRPRVALICGRYEGFDDRTRTFVDEELSLGDFVMTGGEVAAMAVIDACARLLPGVLGNAASSESESHSPALGGLLEYPQYTRPAEFRGLRVPDVLQGGNHALIDAWRRREAERRTAERRPDLWAAINARRAAKGIPS